LALREGRGGEKLRELSDRSHNIDDLSAYFDTSKYPTGKSDVVALTVLEHQTRLHNQITRVDYKLRTVLERDSDDQASGTLRSWSDVPPNGPERLRQVREPLIRTLFLYAAAPFEGRMVGSSGFAERFQKLGPFDSQGRSLRD